MTISLHIFVFKDMLHSKQSLLPHLKDRTQIRSMLVLAVILLCMAYISLALAHDWTNSSPQGFLRGEIVWV